MSAIGTAGLPPLNDLISLDGRVAVITGAGRGIGAGIARRLAEAGAAILVSDLDEPSADAIANELQAGGHRAEACHIDVTDTASVEAAAHTAVERLGRLDIWVNNAGIYSFDPIETMDDATFDATMDVNLRGAFIGSRAAARHMVEHGRGGVILNLASTQSFRAGGIGLIHYNTSKTGIVGLTRSLANELAPHGIRALALAPTLVQTPTTEAAKEQLAEIMGTDQDPWEILVKMFVPLGRHAVPDDIARVALFCVSDLASFMTGATIPVDGGHLAR